MNVGAAIDLATGLGSRYRHGKNGEWITPGQRYDGFFSAGLIEDNLWEVESLVSPIKTFTFIEALQYMKDHPGVLMKVNTIGDEQSYFYKQNSIFACFMTEYDSGDTRPSVFDVRHTGPGVVWTMLEVSI